tara:strand:- start:480 stop:1238 length:759 start_codon:yes stop_codon:yes gene_type:complete
MGVGCEYSSDRRGKVMKTIGLLGGMSWESTATYYRVINERVRDALGPLHSAPLIMHSFNFQQVVDMQKAGDWDGASELLGKAAKGLQDAGADTVLICTNTMHIIAEQVQSHIDIPLLHIADSLAVKMRRSGLKAAGLLGTQFTMEQPFYADRLKNYHLEVVVPEEAERKMVHQIIFEELCCGVIKDSSKRVYQEIIAQLESKGADSIVLGCTEIGLLIREEDCTLPVFDTAIFHAEAAADFCMEECLGQKNG